MDLLPPLDTDAQTPRVDQPNAFSELQSEQFIKIMFTELANQDPMKPNDSAAMLQQISSLRQIQSDIDLGDKLKALVKDSELAQAGGLIGRLVSGISETNERVTGQVVGVSRTKDGAVLTLDDGSRVSFSKIDELVDERIVGDATPPEEGGNG